MPLNNEFYHQDYSAIPTPDQYELGEALSEQCPAVGSEQFKSDTVRCGDVFRHNKIARIILVHGTFVGNDAFGAIERIEKSMPQSGLLGRLRTMIEQSFPDIGAIRDISKKLADSLNSDRGNYTDDYASLLQTSMHSPPQIERFFWSSANHHLARAEAAIKLLHHLLTLPLGPEDRIQLWGHSHAGNVFAIMTNLLANHRAKAAEFFDACSPHLRDDPTLRKLRAMLLSLPSPCPLAHQLDVITFGTPVRYGWDTNGYGKLLHFVNHRAATDSPPYAVTTAHKPSSLISSEQGDYVQVLGIAGSDMIPVVSTKGDADRELGHLLERGLKQNELVNPRWRNLYEGKANQRRIENSLAFMKRIRSPPRVHQDGLTLLVHYDGPTSRLLGHDVYTRERWLHYHLVEITRRLYQ